VVKAEEEELKLSVSASTGNTDRRFTKGHELHQMLAEADVCLTAAHS
jgi:hypothetical protein